MTHSQFSKTQVLYLSLMHSTQEIRNLQEYSLNSLLSSSIAALTHCCFSFAFLASLFLKMASDFLISPLHS